MILRPTHFKKEFVSYQGGADDYKIAGTAFKEIEDEKNPRYVCFKNLKCDEYMFMANNIFSSYYWWEDKNEK